MTVEENIGQLSGGRMVSYACDWRRLNLPPLQGESLPWMFSGLKPWAEVYSPFRVQTFKLYPSLFTLGQSNDYAAELWRESETLFFVAMSIPRVDKYSP
jgi:hypothetical protein